MTGALRLRQSAHRGAVVAVGFVIDAPTVGVGEARRRVIELWQPGAVVTEHAGALVVTGLRPRRVRVALAPGAPLVEQAGLLTAAPLTESERAELARQAPPGSVVTVEGGEAIVRRLAADAAIDITAWIDLGALTLVSAVALAAPPAVATIPVTPTLDLRATVGLGAAPAGAAGAAGAIARATDEAPAPSWWQRLKAGLARRLSRSDAEAAPADSAPTADAAHDTALAPPGLTSSWRSRLRARLAAGLWRSWFGGVLGRQHGRYLRDLLARFDHGDLDDALRHAIGIGGGRGVTSLALTTPRPRDRIAPSTTRPAGTAFVPLATTAHDLLRQRYRAAFDRLLRAGRIDEAAFVLADLLGERAAAVDLLERHDRFTLAARLAEGHELDGALITRLWFLAGDRPRAIAAARRHQAWAGAVAHLERVRDPRAADLRWLWAEHLAATGDPAGAVDVAWPLTDRRAALRPWIERGLTIEDPAAARLLVRSLVLAPTTLPAVAAAITAMLRADAVDGVARRRALATELCVQPAEPALRALARVTVRALWRDLGRGDGGDGALATRLLAFADDPALRADRPPLRFERPLGRAVDGAAAVRRWAERDAGRVAIHDAAALPGGRLLVALGELGVRVLARDGRVLAHLDQPATELVIADAGTTALGLIRRDRFLRVARLDLLARRAAPWIVAECDGGARSFDGDTWITVRGGEVLAIDATAAGWRALWGVDTEQPIRGVDRDGAHLAVVTAAEVWFHDRLVLRRRRDLVRAAADDDGVRVHRIRARPATGDWAVLRSQPGRDRIDLAVIVGDRAWLVGPGAPLGFELDGDLAAVARVGPDGVQVDVIDVGRPGGRPTAAVALDGAAAVSLRFSAGGLTIADDRGRLLVLDPRSGAVRADVRLQA